MKLSPARSENSLEHIENLYKSVCLRACVSE
jgi:hypothetical protein